MNKKILGFTSIRSDYDLMSPLYKLLDNDEEIDFSIVVSGAHLSSQSGHSVSEIENDGFLINSRIDTLLSSDSKEARVKSSGILLQELVGVVSKAKPDLLIYAGDREDVLIYAMVGAYLGIPTAHFYSGDHVPDGYVDNPVRHATSKLSSLHFVALEQHRERLIKMGEDQSRIFNVGNISLDRFTEFSPLSDKELETYFNINVLPDKYALVIFHPITSEIDRVDRIFESILESLSSKGFKAFISHPNVDPGNSKIRKLIKKYESDSDFVFYKNLPRDIFLSVYKKSSMIIGNSSSGVYEAATVKIPAINVGERQKGRFADENVIFSESDGKSIEEALDHAVSDGFQQQLINIKNSYGNGDSAQKAYQYLNSINYSDFFEKREDPLSQG